MTFTVYRSGLVFRDWRWRLRARNGRIIATSGEGYRNKADCYAAVDLIKGASMARVVEV